MTATPDEIRDASIRRQAPLGGGTVVGSLLWTDPSGGWWIAPLGSRTPSPDGMPPPEWVPIKIEQRTDMA